MVVWHLSAEIISRIVQMLDSQSTLLTLCHTSKELQREAESVLYERLVLGVPQITYRACKTLCSNTRAAAHVRAMFIYYHSEEVAVASRNLPQSYWEVIHAALSHTPNLEQLYIADASPQHSWILQSERFVFQLQEANILFKMDSHVVRFLKAQKGLQKLQTESLLDEEDPEPFSGLDFPRLVQYYGTVDIAAQLTDSPLVRLKLINVSDTSIAFLLPLLSGKRDTLRSLFILGVLEDKNLLGLMRDLSTYCSQLRYLGLIPLPYNFPELHHYLHKFSNLIILDLNATYFKPALLPPQQRLIVTDIAVYCPSLKVVLIWIGQRKIVWTIQKDGKWTHEMDPGYSQNEELWLQV